MRGVTITAVDDDRGAVLFNTLSSRSDIILP